MIPNFIIYSGCSWPLLPPGIHDAGLDEIYNRFVTNGRRRDLFDGLTRALDNLFLSGCPEIFLDGSYVTEKPFPNDYEVCWNASFVDPNLLDPVFLDFSNQREKQKQKYLGEFFPALATERASGKSFLDFFQTDKETGNAKGIIRVLNFKNGRRAV